MLVRKRTGKVTTPVAPIIPYGRIYSNRQLPTNQLISNLSVIGLEKPCTRQWAATYGFGAGRLASSRTRREKRSIDLRAETTSAGRTSKGIA